MTACIGTPISWLRLERFALAGPGGDAQITEHLAACPACARCLDDVQRDVVALPVLAVPPRRAPLRWWRLAGPALAVAAAAVAIVIWRGDRDPRVRADVVSVKGVGEVVVGVVRERAGTIRDDASTFLPGDRWKVVVTCPPAAAAWVDIDVGGDHPLAPARIACGNRVVIPGAFSLTGSAPNRICVRVAAAGAPAIDAPRACVVIRPGD